MTGENVLRTGITEFLDNKNSLYLNPDEFLALPALLKQNNYRTALLGKWHLNAGYDVYPANGAPVYHGFDDVIMSEQRYIADGDYFAPYNHLPQVTYYKPNEYLIDRMNKEAVDYIEKRAKEDKPFMLYFSHYATHTRLDAPQDTLEYFQNKRGQPADRNVTNKNPYLAAMLKHIDDGVGMIKEKLIKLGIFDNTIFVIGSDNGGSGEFTDNGELRGGKRHLYEGGIRDPLIISWPKYIKQGAVVNYPSSVMDLYSTFAEAAGIPKDNIPTTCGESLMPLIKLEGVPERDTLYWVYPRFSTLAASATFTQKTNSFMEGAAIRKGDFKYLESLVHDRQELYNLNADPGENVNIINMFPDLVRQMKIELHELLERDTVGKRMSFTFANDEYYRWNVNGFEKSGGAYNAMPSSVCAATMETSLFYDTEIETEFTIGNSGKAGIILRATNVPFNHGLFGGYAVTVSRATQTVEIYVIRENTLYLLESANAAVDENVKLKVVTDSDKIDVYLNYGPSSQPVLSTYDNTYFKGTFGIYSENALSSFKQFTILGIERTRQRNNAQLKFD